MEVGVRELRDHLSRDLDRVRDGAELVVTDRGHAIARVVPAAANVCWIGSSPKAP